MKLTLEKMCPEVFELDKDELRILKHLSEQGPMNLTQLSKYTSKYALGLERWAVKKRLDGTNRFQGLIPNEYVIEEITKKNRYGKQEKRYWLTVKGIIASSSVVPLENNTLFRHYIWAIADKVKNNTIENFAKKAIHEFIKLLIAWHYLQGIQLTKQKSSKFYYLETLEHMRNVNGIDVTITDKEIEKEFIEIVRNCVAYYTVIDLLTRGGLGVYGYTLSIVDQMKPEKDKNPEHYHTYSKIWEWSLYLGDPQFHSQGDIGEITAKDIIRTDVSIESVYSKSIKKKIDSIIKEIKYKIDWDSKI